MLSKDKFILVFASFFIAGLCALLLPVKANAGSAVGCCINNGGNCNPGCGSIGDDCQVGDGPKGSCKDVLTLGDTCGGLDATNVDCFVEGATCLQVANNTGECVPLEIPEEPDCETGSGQEAIDEACQPDTCFDASCPEGVCVFTEDETNDPSCVAPDVAVVPTLSQWGIIFAAIILGFFAIVTLRRSKDSEI